MRKPKFDQLFYADLLLFAALFLVHRALTFTMLNADVLTGTRQVSGFFVGMLSDLWISGLLALLTAGCQSLILMRRTLATVRRLRMIFFGMVALLLASHQSYVEFFGFTMMAFHLRYLYDSAFLVANGQSLLGWPLAVYCGTAAMLLAWQYRQEPREPARSRAALLVITILALVLIHNRNIHWRVQWFIPENLQVNLLEKLFTQLSKAKAIEPVRPAERERLLAALRLPGPVTDFPSMMREVRDLPAGPLHPISGKLQEHWQAARDAGRKPLLTVLLLESLRPSETGYFAPQSKSLTPELDRLAASSIVFRNAWSTGSVTRGGQEAVFCGHISSRDTSLMRYDAVAPIRCLTDFLAKSDTETFWYHGGNGLFDNQLSFWRKHGMKELLTQDDFAQDAPHTSWGVGDITFLQRSAAELRKRRDTAQFAAQVGLLLTVTNHIPWDMPADIVPWSLPLNSRHPSYRTTAYTDHAVRLFVERLKAEGLWDDSILVLSSDHGNQVPAYQDLYAARPPAAARLQSHINFIITGGLVERALRDFQLGSLTRDALVSQVDISQFLADILGLKDFTGMGENPFLEERRLPVLSRLEQHLFDPASQSLLDPKAFQSEPQADANEKNLLFYRSYLDYISTK